MLQGFGRKGRSIIDLGHRCAFRFVATLNERGVVAVGQALSIRRSFTQAEVLAFANLTGDHNPIHSDKAAARAAGFDRPLCHGMLYSTLPSMLFARTVPRSMADISPHLGTCAIVDLCPASPLTGARLSVYLTDSQLQTPSICRRAGGGCHTGGAIQFEPMPWVARRPIWAFDFLSAAAPLARDPFTP